MIELRMPQAGTIGMPATGKRRAETAQDGCVFAVSTRSILVVHKNKVRISGILESYRFFGCLSGDGLNNLLQDTASNWANFMNELFKTTYG